MNTSIRALRPLRALPLLAALVAMVPAANAQTSPVEPVWTKVREHKAPLVETLREIVNIESGSRDLEGLAQLAGVLATRLTALGGKTELVDVGGEMTKLFDSPAQVGKVVVSRFEGTGTRRLLLLAHMDTVYPRGTLARRSFRIDGHRAYGPGIADDKGGIAVMLHALAILKSLDFRDYKQITVAINGDEEISSPGSRKLIERLGAEHDLVLSCEPTTAMRPDVPITLATSGIAAATITVRGRASHAGAAPELGRNALMELAHQLLQTNNLGDKGRGISFNWTMANAGTTRNVIPDTATAAADVRVRALGDYDAVEKAFLARTKTQLIADTKVEPEFERRRPPLEANERSRALARKAQAIYAEIGKRLGFEDSGSGGGTDAAFAALSGKPVVIESLGLAGFNYHSMEEEYVDLDTVEPRLYLLVRLIMDSARP